MKLIKTHSSMKHICKNLNKFDEVNCKQTSLYQITFTKHINIWNKINNFILVNTVAYLDEYHLQKHLKMVIWVVIK